jgi:hypothetical protein
MKRTNKPSMKDNAMKKLLTIAALAALAISAQAQRQTFTQPAYFATNVFLADNTNTPLHLRVPTNAVIDGVTSTNGSVTVTTNAGVVNLQVEGVGVSYNTLTGGIMRVGPVSVEAQSGGTGTVQIGIITAGANALGVGAMQIGGAGSNNIASGTGSRQQGFFTGGANSTNIASGRGASQVGFFSSSARTQASADGAHQIGQFAGSSDSFVEATGVGAMQIGLFNPASNQRITASGRGSIMIGDYNGAGSSTNAGDGAIQLFDVGVSGPLQSQVTTGHGSLLLGHGEQTNNYGIIARGPIETYADFIGSAAGLTNFPATLVTASAANTNYYRFTAAPASNTAFGLQHQIAYNSTNIFIYHAASSKWLRVTGTLEW